MSQLPTIRRGLKIGAAVLAIALGLLYAWLAFAPTGYQQQFPAAGQAEALCHADTLLCAEPPQPPSPTMPQLAALAPPATGDWLARLSLKRQPVDFVKTLESMQLYCEDYLDGGYRYRFHAGAMAWTACYLPLDGFKKDLDHLASAATEPQIRKAILEAAVAYNRNQSFPIMPNGKNAGKKRQPWLEEKYPLGKGLDQVEAFLLEQPWRVPEYRDFPYNTWPQSFLQLTGLAILRADLRGEGDKAGRLLERYLEALRLLRLGNFPISESRFMRPNLVRFTQAPLLAAAQSRSLSREALERASALLERSLIGQEEYGKLMQAFAARATLDLKEGRIQPFRYSSFFNNLAYLSLRPVLTRTAQSAALRWVHGRGTSMGQQMIFDGLGKMMKLDGTSPVTDPNLFSELNLEAVNEDLYFSRLVLATELWRRDHGRYPESIQDLIPAYLKRSFIDTGGIEWTVYRYEPPKGSKDVEKPVFCHFEPRYHPLRSSEVTGVMVRIGFPILPFADEGLVEELKKK